jgi:hypothetical protein
VLILSSHNNKSDMTLLFPIALIVLDLGASLVYLLAGDLRRGIYWAAAATLTACVTYA